MRLFRQHGYEGVSIADLTNAIGIAPPSLYAAFKSKAGLYREALDLYSGLPGALEGMTDASTLEQGLEGFFNAAIQAVTAEERGCMISIGLVEGAVEQHELVIELRNRRRELRDRIAETLCKWLTRPEADRLAKHLSALLQGLAVQARDGATGRDLSLTAQDAIAGIVARRSAGYHRADCATN
ncbi:helix-turn-helix domain-containing protein [Novosphingobium sp. BL-8H]|uniref:TetR/AcrR family transcriptional regulator n=1 Tax=Novosphingobium sp. BL-8H TaxID=3127640 RepID=UPI00375709BB